MYLRTASFIALLSFLTYPAGAVDVASPPSCTTNADCQQYPETICRVKHACAGEGPCDSSKFCIVTPKEDRPVCRYGISDDPDIASLPPCKSEH